LTYWLKIEQRTGQSERRRCDNGNTSRPRSVPPRLLNRPLEPARDCNPAVDVDMGLQYEPCNVRHLVQSYQSTVRPTTSDTPPPVNATVARVPDASSRRSNSRVAAEHECDQKLVDSQEGGRSNSQPWGGPRFAPAKLDVNVCVVRPAGGRSLPQPPISDPADTTPAYRPTTPGNRPTTPGSGSSVRKSSATESAQPSPGPLEHQGAPDPQGPPDHQGPPDSQAPTNKVSKVWYEYGCL
jgi:hypothetical protein